MGWREQAACRDVDPELFFPVAAEGTRVFELQARQARQVCAGCPVKGQCLTEALKVGAVGIWAGTTEGQRRNVVAA